MEIPRYWRFRQVRYALVGQICPHCEAKNIPPRDVCPHCGHITHAIIEMAAAQTVNNTMFARPAEKTPVPSYT